MTPCTRPQLWPFVFPKSLLLWHPPFLLSFLSPGYQRGKMVWDLLGRGGPSTEGRLRASSGLAKAAGEGDRTLHSGGQAVGQTEQAPPSH